ncbi:MAG: efflux RND transporter periplasmic adaptor subunit [Muribaculaceae bacterium]|nr:efflux RND transporter periplasmic adaptor subunit [Muribaculaceae bacterium]
MDKIISQDEQRRAKRRKTIKACAWVVAGGAILGTAIFMTTGKSVREADLNLQSATRGPLESAVAASGRLVPAFEEIVNSPVGSHIMEVYARPGDSVKAGMPLLRLDLQEADAQYQNLRDAHDIKTSQLRQLRLTNRSAMADLEMQTQIKEMEVNRLAIEVENERRLDSIGSGTGDRVRQAETAYATGRLELQGLRQRLVNERERLEALETSTALELGNSARDMTLMERTLAQGRIPAPHDGVLTFLKTQIGSTVAPGEKLAVVGDLSSFKVEAEVPEGSSFKVKPGANATVRLGNIELAGTVASVEPQSTSGAVPFTVNLEDASNPRLRPGVRVQVYVGYGFKEDVVRIPMGTYFKGPGDYMLFVDEGNGKARQRKITLGDSNRNWVEVVNGVSPGERVSIADLSAFEGYKTVTLTK